MFSILVSSPPPRLASPVLALLALLALLPLLAMPCTGQVRFAYRSGAHLDGQGPGSPLRVNDYAAGDVDGDGDPDLLVMAGDFCRVYFNAGSAAFPTHRNLQLGTRRRVVLVDVDGDKDLDAVCTAGTNSHYVFPGQTALLLNDGKGNFTDASSKLPQVKLLAREIFSGDIDGDGDADLVLILDNTLPITVWTNDGKGSFTDKTSTAVVGQSGTATFGGLVDLDGDQDLDIVLSPGQLFRNDGKGKFTKLNNWSGPATVRALADFNGDGSVDVLTDTQVLQNDKTGLGFKAVASLPSLGSLTRVSVADFDGDKQPDVLGTDTAAVPRLFLRSASAAFTEVTMTWFQSHVLVDRSVDSPYGTHEVVDLDGDGDPDVVTGGVEGRASSSTTVGIPPKVFLNAGGKKLVHATRRAFPYVQAGIAAVAAGDVDGDGNVDLYLHYHGYYKLPGASDALWLQNDRGEFLEGAGLPGGGISAAATFADVDGDGDLDLLTGRGFDPVGPPQAAAHRLFLNDGRGRFTDATSNLPTTAKGAAAALVAGDVDGDGDIDFVTGEQHPTIYGSPTGGQNRLFLNDGKGRFSDATKQLPSGADDTTALRLADLDGDRDLDLLVQNGRFSTPPAGFALRFLENDGKGNFSDATKKRIPTLSNAKELDVVDADGDGDLDITLSNATLINNGSGVFTSKTAGKRILARDFDEDGTLDNLQGGFVIAGQSYTWGNNIQSYGALALDLDQDRDLDLVLFGLGPASGGAQWTILPVGVLHNQRRDLRVTALPRLGQPFRLALRAGGKPKPDAAIPAVALGVLRPRFQVPGLGAFALDWKSLVILPPVMPTDADTPVQMEFQVPNTTALAGLNVAVQALFVPAASGPSPQFSNLVVHEVTL